MQVADALSVEGRKPEKCSNPVNGEKSCDPLVDNLTSKLSNADTENKLHLFVCYLIWWT